MLKINSIKKARRFNVNLLLIILIIVFLATFGYFCCKENIEKAESQIEIEVEIVDIQNLHQYILIYLKNPIEIDIEQEIVIEIDNILFPAYYYHTYRPKDELEERQSKFLNQPIGDHIGFWFDSQTAKKLGLKTSEDIKGHIMSSKIKIIKKPPINNRRFFILAYPLLIHNQLIQKKQTCG